MLKNTERISAVVNIWDHTNSLFRVSTERLYPQEAINIHGENNVPQPTSPQTPPTKHQRNAAQYKHRQPSDNNNLSNSNVDHSLESKKHGSFGYCWQCLHRMEMKVYFNHNPPHILCWERVPRVRNLEGWALETTYRGWSQEISLIGFVWMVVLEAYSTVLPQV